MGGLCRIPSCIRSWTAAAAAALLVMTPAGSASAAEITESYSDFNVVPAVSAQACHLLVYGGGFNSAQLAITLIPCLYMPKLRFFNPP